jgi:lipopolysaccharide export LptBFGC system permease protein LptF
VNIPQRGRSYILLFIFFKFSVFICVVSSVANDQLQSQHEYKQQQQHDNTGQNKHNKKETTQTKKIYDNSASKVII